MTDVDDTQRGLACRAVAHALRPRLRKVIHDEQVTWPAVDEEGVVRAVADVLHQRINAKTDAARTLPWWEASGYTLTTALMELRGIDEPLASHLVGAALQAQISARQDLVSDYVLRLAEAAAVWLDGANLSTVTTA